MLNTLTSPPKNTEPFRAHFNALKKDSLFSIREAAWATFLEKGFPKKNEEEWRHTDISPLFNFRFGLPDSSKTISSSELNFPALPVAISLVFMEGEFSEQHSSLKGLPEGALVSSLQDAINKHSSVLDTYFAKNVSSENGFSALNTALAGNGVFVFFPDNTPCDIPIFIVHRNNNSGIEHFVQSRNLLIAGKNSKFQVAEIFVSGENNSGFRNSVSEIFTDENSAVDFFSLKNERNNTFHVDTVTAKQKAGSRFSSFSFTLGGSLVRNNLSIRLEGRNCHTEMFGLSISKNKSHVDNHTLVDHAFPDCLSNQLYKGIADDFSSGVFNGKIMVRKDAQKTNAFQSNKNLLLTEQASMNSKPQLEIFADDVKCSHGATTGQLDHESLFYLRSRGIGEDQARRMLVSAFAEDIVNKVSLEWMRNYLNDLISERLS